MTEETITLIEEKKKNIRLQHEFPDNYVNITCSACNKKVGMAQIIEEVTKEK